MSSHLHGLRPFHPKADSCPYQLKSATKLWISSGRGRQYQVQEREERKVQQRAGTIQGDRFLYHPLTSQQAALRKFQPSRLIVVHWIDTRTRSTCRAPACFTAPITSTSTHHTTSPPTSTTLTTTTGPSASAPSTSASQSPPPLRTFNPHSPLSLLSHPFDNFISSSIVERPSVTSRAVVRREDGYIESSRKF